MSRRIKAGQLQRVAGILTWAAVSGFALYLAAKSGERYAGAVPAAALLAGVNLAAMLFAIRHEHGRGAATLAALWIQLFSALWLGWLLPISFVPIYTIIWIAMATGFYSFRACWWLLGGLMIAWYLIQRFVWGEDNVVIVIVLYGTFHLFAMLSARNAAEAETARDQVEALNRELLATQHLLAEASRQSERTRIARDLHDLLGHHLTALSINLQIAERITEGEAKAKVEESRALARLLLSDVRDAVSTLRDESAVDFARAISLLVDNTPELDINVDIEDGLKIDEVDVAESLLRCVQEAITNTLRHAGARRSWIRVWRENGYIKLDVHDDGSMSGEITEGNGLVGIRERLAQIHGSLQLGKIEKALHLHVEIPLAG